MRPDPSEALEPGRVAWANLDPPTGREQGGHRPVVVVASPQCLAAVDALALIVPLTTRDRGWPNHVPISGSTGLPTASWAMTEQLRCISRKRITSLAGTVDAATLTELRDWLGDHLDFELDSSR